MLAAGRSFGQFEVLARLKSGGMATLFLARRVGSSGFKRHVAIKIVHEHLAEDESFVQMFVEEALLQARIHHPNVVHVEELGEQDGQHFLVMEYVHGCSLAQLMTALAKRDRRLAPDIAVNIAAQTAAGLHAAHELKDDSGASLGVVHRDVSPQNVLLAYEGHVKLIDFGVAKAKNRESTSGGSLKGKLRYMPPEQAFGRPVDRRSDVYALGIVLWEMLTMRRLFHADEDLALLEMVRQPRIEPPSTYAADVSPALDAVVMKALALAPEDRYATAQDFRRALAEAAPGALLMDASSLAELLAAVMQHEIDKDRQNLPLSVSAVIANVERRDGLAARSDEALHTMTISAAGIDYLGGGRPTSGVASGISRSVAARDGSRSGVARDGSRSGASGVVVEGSLPGARPDITGALAVVERPSLAPLEVESLPAEEPGRGSRRALGIGIALAIVVAVAGGATVLMLSRGESEMVATPLAPMPVAEPADVAPPGQSEAPAQAAGSAQAADSAAAPVDVAVPEEPPPVPATEEAPTTAPASSAPVRATARPRPGRTRPAGERSSSSRGPGGTILVDEF